MYGELSVRRWLRGKAFLEYHSFIHHDFLMDGVENKNLNLLCLSQPSELLCQIERFT